LTVMNCRNNKESQHDQVFEFEHIIYGLKSNTAFQMYYILLFI